MFEYQPKRHPLQTFQFWFLVIVCAAGVGAWRTGLITLPATTELDRRPTIEFEKESMPPPPLLDEDDSSAEESETVGEISSAPPQAEEDISPEPDEPNVLASQPDTSLLVIEESNGTHSEVQNISAESIDPGQSAIAMASHTEIPETVIPPRQIEPVESSPLELNTSPKPVVDEVELQPVPIDFTNIVELMHSGDDVAALRQLSILYWERPADRSLLQDRLSVLSRRIFFHPHPHYVEPYQVAFGDRLETIAKKYDVPWEYLSKINRTPPEKLRAGQTLKVIQGPFNIVVDLSDLELTVHAGGYYVVHFPIGIGKDESTPVGTFRVTDKVQDPIYYGPDEVIAADDPSNPLGEFWIAFSDEAKTIQGFGLHGTIDSSSIGEASSRGCVRLHDQHIEDLYNLLTIGSEVVIRR